MKPTNTIPGFETEAQERAYWETHDTAELMEHRPLRRVRFPNLKKSTRAISIRLPEDLLESLKVRANSMDVPYQSLIKIILSEGLERMEHHRTSMVAEEGKRYGERSVYRT